MAASYRSISNLAYAGRTDSTIPAPASIADGDTLVAGLFMGRPGAVPHTPTPPTGWAAVEGTWPVALTDGSFNGHVRLYYKIASGESGDYTFTHDLQNTACWCVCIIGGDGAQPKCTQNSGFVQDTTALSVTPDENDSLIIYVAQDWGDTATDLTAPTGTTPTFTERLDATLWHICTGVLATAGATGDKTAANNSSTDTPNPWSGYLVAIEPPGGGGGILASVIAAYFKMIGTH